MNTPDGGGGPGGGRTTGSQPWGICFNCNQSGHIQRDCPDADPDNQTCYRCGVKGHMTRDCPEEVKDDRKCYNCGQTGHLSRDCAEDRTFTSGTRSSRSRGQECYRCGEMDHFARDCPNSTMNDVECYNCQETGHFARDCPESGGEVQCYNWCTGLQILHAVPDNVERKAMDTEKSGRQDGNGKDGSENDGSGDLNEAVGSLHINTNTADNETQAKPAVGATSGYKSSKHKRDNYSNFFLALRITDEECINNFQAIQKVLSRRFPQYKYYAIPKNGFHVTLSLLHLETDADVARCIAALQDIRPRIVEMCKLAEPLVFEGFGLFSSKVIYADVKRSPRLNRLVDTIETHLVHAHVRVVPQGRYIPHMTLFKVSQADWPRQLPELSLLAGTRIGKQAVDNVCLCQMGTLTEASHFYRSPLTIVVRDNE